jgi:hypothetical protein
MLLDEAHFNQKINNIMSGLLILMHVEKIQAGINLRAYRVG